MKQIFYSKKIGILIIIIGVAVVFGVVSQKDQTPLAEKDKPCIPLAGKGKQIYEIRTGEPSNFQIVKVEVDPIDVKAGETQKITVQVKDNESNTITGENRILANIFTDNKSTAIAATAFKLARAEESKDKGKSFLTTWEGYWTRDDSNCRIYMETITAINDKGEETKVDLSFK